MSTIASWEDKSWRSYAWYPQSEVKVSPDIDRVFVLEINLEAPTLVF